MDEKENVQVRGFTFFLSYWTALKALPVDAWPEWITAFMEFMFYGKEPAFENPYLKANFENIRPVLEKSITNANNRRGKYKRDFSQEKEQEGIETDKNERERTKRNEMNSEIRPPKDKEKDKGEGLGNGVGEREEGDKPPAPAKKTGKKVFTPPTLEEVQTYITENGLSVDAEHFFNFFTAGNWIDSKGNPVKNWKQKLLTWDSMEQKRSAPAKEEKKPLPAGMSQETYNKIHSFPEHDYDFAAIERKKLQRG